MLEAGQPPSPPLPWGWIYVCFLNGSVDRQPGCMLRDPGPNSGTEPTHISGPHFPHLPRASLSLLGFAILWF
jgi:hypothetical protein